MKLKRRLFQAALLAALVGTAVCAYMTLDRFFHEDCLWYLLGALVLFISLPFLFLGAFGHKPEPVRSGIVIGHSHTPASRLNAAYVPGRLVGGEYTPRRIIPAKNTPETFQLKVRDPKTGRVGLINVSETDYHGHPVDSYYQGGLS